MVKFWNPKTEWEEAKKYYGFTDEEAAMYFYSQSLLPEGKKRFLPSVGQRAEVWELAQARIRRKRPGGGVDD